MPKRVRWTKDWRAESPHARRLLSRYGRPWRERNRLRRRRLRLLLTAVAVAATLAILASAMSR